MTNVILAKKIDTVPTHGLDDLQQALDYDKGSIMEPVCLNSAQAYHNSAEMETGLANEIGHFPHSRFYK